MILDKSSVQSLHEFSLPEYFGWNFCVDRCLLFLRNPLQTFLRVDCTSLLSTKCHLFIPYSTFLLRTVWMYLVLGALWFQKYGKHGFAVSVLPAENWLLNTGLWVIAGICAQIYYLRQRRRGHPVYSGCTQFCAGRESAKVSLFILFLH
jgi:hypothetical protein